MKNRIDDLRNHLFETLEALRDDEKPMDLDRAKTVATVAQVIVDSAKAEIEFAKVTGQIPGTGFMPAPHLEAPPAPGEPRLVKGRASA
ncbi:MAG: hypothetical protein ACREUX_13900 [Burkholderiales bacterium]